MECPRAAEIKTKLLSSPFRLILDKYSDFSATDPLYFTFHEASTVLALRQELGLPFGRTNGCDDCEHNTLAKCRVIPVLKEAIRERSGEGRPGTISS